MTLEGARLFEADLTKADLTDDPQGFIQRAAKLAPLVQVETVNALQAEQLMRSLLVLFPTLEFDALRRHPASTQTIETHARNSTLQFAGKLGAVQVT